MKFLSVRDLKTKSSQVWKELPEEKEVIITNNGRPIALMVPLEETNVEQTISSFRQAKAVQAVHSMQQQSLKNGLNNMTMEEINQEILSTKNDQER
jgi:prevent-host-death family protein